MGEAKLATIKLLTTGDLSIPFTIIKGREALAQRLKNRFKFFKGEWFLDKRKGAPFYDRILVKSPDMRIVRVLLRMIVLRTPGVKDIKRFEFSLDRPSRTLTVTELEVTDTDGQVFRAQPQEFVLTFP